MQHFIKVFFGLALFIISSPMLAQQALPDQVQAYFRRYQEDFPVEKAYLHLDKFPYYNSETATKHLLIVKGIDQNGRLGRLVNIVM